MGDTRRFAVVADFVAHNFSPCHAADVAGGTGLLAKHLEARGFTCDVIDSRSYHGRKPSRLVRDRFVASMADQYDLLIGLHPDDATMELCRAAKSGVPVVIIPCCRMGPGADKEPAGSICHIIRSFLTQEHIPWWETSLRMSGKNLVFVINKGT